MDKRRWRDLGSDVDWVENGGMWGRRVSPGVWLIVRFENQADWGDGASGYYAEVKYVNLHTLTPETRASVKRSCDIPDEADGDEAWWVSACVDHGAAAPLWSTDGTRYAARVREAAIRQADEYRRDPSLLDGALDNEVNKVGTTAREYGQGRIVFRNLDKPEIALCAKLSGIPTDPMTVETAKQYGIEAHRV